MRSIFYGLTRPIEILRRAAQIHGATKMIAFMSWDVSDQSPEGLAQHMSKLAKRSDKVTILGNQEIDLVLAMVRLGFLDVMCREPAYGPHIASDAADFVLAPAVKNEAELAHAAIEAKRTLKRGGLFLMRFSGGALDVIDRVLGRYGFAAVPEPGGLLCCRRLSVA